MPLARIFFSAEAARRFDENDVRAMGRDAVGVRGIRLRDGDYVVGAARAAEGKCLLDVYKRQREERKESASCPSRLDPSTI